MDKSEYQDLLDQIQNCVNKRDYKKAYELAKTVDWKRVKSFRTLNMIADIYDVNKDYEAEKGVLIIAKNRASLGKGILYRLVEVSLKLGDVEVAGKYFDEFVKVAPNDNGRILLDYQIAKASNQPLERQIELLEEYKRREYTEKWTYELALLYSKDGNKEKCVEICDDMILWFSEGKYVLRAMELKQRYVPLTPSQQDYFDKEQRDSDPRLFSGKKSFATGILEIGAKKEAPVVEAKLPEMPVEVANAVEEIIEEPVIVTDESNMPKRDSLSVLERMNAAGAKVTENVEYQATSAIQLSPEDIDKLSVTSPMFMGGDADLTAMLEKSKEAVYGQAEVKPEPAIEIEVPAAEPVAEPEVVIEVPAAEPVAEPEVVIEVPAAEPVAEPEVVIEVPAVEPIVEPVAEPAAEPAADIVIEAPQEEVKEEAPVLIDIDLEKKDDQADEVPVIDLSFEQPVVSAQEEIVIEEPVVEPVEETAAEIVIEEPVVAAPAEEPMAEIVVEEPVVEPVSEPEVELIVEEPVSEPEAELVVEEPAAVPEAEPVPAEPVEEVKAEETDAFAPKKNAPAPTFPSDWEIPDPEPTEEERRTHTLPLGKIGQNTVPISVEEILKSETPEERRIRILNNASPTRMSDEQRQIFTYFARIPGIDTQILEAVTGVYKFAGEKTSRRGNIAVMGAAGTGKTRLSYGLIVMMCKDMGLEAVKTARINGERMNELDPAAVVAKVSGGFLAIENASDMNAETIAKLNQAMEFKTDCMILIIEDEKNAIRAMFKKYPEFAEKFTGSISIPAFTNDELVTFARTYCAENNCELDEMGVLALYSMISNSQSEEQPVSITTVKEMIDAAISHAKRTGRKARKGLKGKTIVLYEKDFIV